MSRAYWIAESKLRLILVFSYKLIGDVKVAEKVEPGLFVMQVGTSLALAVAISNRLASSAAILPIG